jgi:hypothetical protein
MAVSEVASQARRGCRDQPLPMMGSGCFHSFSSCSPCVSIRSAISRLPCSVTGTSAAPAGVQQEGTPAGAAYLVAIGLKLRPHSPRLHHDLLLASNNDNATPLRAVGSP